MAQEPSLLTDFSTRATQEYSDLFAVSGTSFLSPAIDQTATTIEPNSPPSPKPPLSNHLPDNSSLIDLLSKTPLPPKRTHPPASQDHDDEISKLQHHSPTRSSKKYSFLMDHSISSFDLLPKALSPSTPSSRKNIHPTSKPAVSPHPHWTPPTSPTKAHHILSSHLNFDPPTPSAQSKTKSSQSGSTNITRTHSVDLIALEHNHTPRPSISRSKSTTAIQHEQTHQAEPSCLSDDSEPPKATKSILKRPNSPSKGARARFFSPRVVSGLSGDEESDGNESSWVDEHGNCRGREIIHEFQKDEPPMTRPNPIFKPPCISQSTTPRKTVLPSSVPASSSSSNGRRHHHTPKFIIPEPIDLGIDPILPRHSTSPSPSPPPIPAASYLMNAKAHRKSASVNVIQPPRNQITRAASESLIFNAPDNFSNILDESGGFLCGNETTWTGENKERSTELSIDLNHVAMMELLGKKKAGDNRTVSRPGPKFNTRGSECEVVPEEEESVDVSGLARQLQDIKSCPLDNLALKDEQAPANLQASMDFSTTFELSKINLPPLPTDRDQLWKNSKPMEPSMTRPKRHSMSNVYQHVGKRGVTDGDTTRLKNKIDSIKLSAREDTRSVTKDDLFSELMSAPPPSLTTQREKVSQPNKAHPPTSKITTALPSARPSTAHKRLSGQLVAFPGKPIESKITHTNPVSKPRRSCISTSVVPVRPKRTSNIGIGLPPSTSAPVIHTLTKLSAKTNSNTTGLTGVRSKLKPSNALVKPSQTSGSPKTMKNRSSLSNINLNSPRLLHRASPSKNIATPVPTTATNMTTMMASPTNTRKTIPVPGSTTGRTLPAPRSYTASSASSARSALLDGPPRSALPPPGSLSNRPRTAPLSSAIPASSQPSRILPPSSPSKTLARQIKQKI